MSPSLSESFRRFLAKKDYLTSQGEARRHARVEARLVGRGMLADGTEFECVTSDVSAGGMSIVAAVQPPIGQRLVVYLELIGGLEGEVVRVMDTGFGMTFNATLRKRDKIADQLTWLINRDLLGADGLRQHQRIKPQHLDYKAQLGNRGDCDVRIIDLSRTGVAVLSPVIPAIGSRVTIGTTRGKVVRTLAGGFAIEFSRSIPVEYFDVDVKL
jgi:hypothetical protein